MLDFTKGPWEAEEIYDSFWAVFANDLPVAECNNNEANARLIAAAPEMYRILCNIRDQLSDVDLDTDTEDDIHVILACIDGKEASYD